MVTLNDAKNYLRVDFNDDDKLISDLILTAKNLVCDVGRMTEKQLEIHEDTTRMAMLFVIGYFYENRNTADLNKLTLQLRSILFAQREGVI